MDQIPMFFEQAEDALGYAVAALGGAKAVGVRLRPDLPADAAGRWALDCLNADRPQFFHPGQVLAILRLAREAGVHVAMDWICQSAGYAKPAPMEPQDEQAALMRQFIQAAELLRHTQARIEQMAGAATDTGLRVVKA